MGYAQTLVSAISELPGVRIPSRYKSLIVVMGLPLLDGVFLSLVLTGGLNSLQDALMVGSFVIGGGASVGIILSEFNQSFRTGLRDIFLINIFVGSLAVTQALVALSFDIMIATETFTFGAVISLVLLSVKVAPVNPTVSIPNPSTLVLLFLLLSFEPSNVNNVEIIYDTEAALYAVVAVAVSTVISAFTLYVQPVVSEAVNPDSLKYGTSVGLIAIALSILGVLPSISAPLLFFSIVTLGYFGHA